MSGFYERFGIANSWSKENINQFLDQEKIKFIYFNINQLFEKATKQFLKQDDIIFLFFVEVIRFVFLKKFEIFIEE